MSLTSSQEESVTNFIEFTGSERYIAENLLKEFKWNVENASNAYLDDTDKYMKKYEKLKPKAEVKKHDAGKPSDYDTFFREYATPGTDFIEMEGLMKLYEGLGIELTDVITTLLPYHWKMESFEKLKKSEFIAGMQEIGAKNLSQLKSKVPGLRSEIKSIQALKPIYNYAFDLFRDRSTVHKLLSYDVAILLWGQLVTSSIYPYAEQWKAYLAEYQKDLPQKKPVTRDVWNMFYEFVVATTKDSSGLSKMLAEDEWPLMIEGFAKYLKGKISS
jgi:hypothetical protein